MAEANASIPKPFGPTYDLNGVTLAKFRRKPFSLTREERRAYGEAVEKRSSLSNALRSTAKQRPIIVQHVSAVLGTQRARQSTRRYFSSRGRHY
jgi:hypothetical protein